MSKAEGAQSMIFLFMSVCIFPEEADYIYLLYLLFSLTQYLTLSSNTSTSLFVFTFYPHQISKALKTDEIDLSVWYILSNKHQALPTKNN